MRLFAAKLLTLALLALAFSFSASAADVNTGANLIAKTIKDAGGISNAANDLSVEIVKGKSQAEALLDGSLEVTKLDFNVAAGTFRAYISVNGNLPFETAGNYHEVIKLPVLNRKLEKNQIISKADISYLEVEPSKLKGAFITKEAELIGKTPVHSIYKARPIAVGQLTAPKVIERNKRVTIAYNNNALRIQDTAIAMESGAVGEIIKFKNANSNRLITAKIINESLAEVESNNSIVASN